MVATSANPAGQRVIGTSNTRLREALREYWQSREILYFLTWRDLKVRYKQTAVGVAWAVLQPVLTMALLSAIFGHLVRLGTNGAPYPAFVLIGLVTWQFFSYSLSQAGTSLVRNERMLTRVYLPRLFIPTASVLAALVDLAIASVVLGGFLVYYGVGASLSLLAVPLFVLMLFATALGINCWTAALNVRYRDVQHALPFLTQLWFFATPIVYSSTIVPKVWRTVLGLNPMSGVVEGLRWAILGGPEVGAMVAVSAVASAVLLVTGVAFFRRVEQTFADVV